MKWILPLVLALVLASCDGETPPIEPPVVDSIEDLSSITTATVAGSVPVKVRLLSGGSGASGVMVVFETQNGTAQPPAATSGPDGTASTTWTLGTLAGTQQLLVTAGGKQLVLSVDALAGPATELTRVSGNDQLGQPGNQLALPLIVGATDAWGNPVPGTTLQFDAGTSGGSVDPASTQTAANGRGQTTWTLGPSAGVQTLTVRSAGLPDLAFSAVAQSPLELLVAPTDWAMPPGEQVAFAAWTASSAAPPVKWYVNGIEDGDATVGRIQSGVYTAPSNPAMPSVAVRAVDTATGAVGESVVQFTPTPTVPPALAYTETSPRVINPSSSDSLEILVAVDGYTSAIEMERTSLPTLHLQAWRTGMFRLKIAAGQALAGYVEGDLHNFVGFLVPAGTPSRYNLFVNVRDATIPDVAVVSIAADAQRSDYVLNLRFAAVGQNTLADVLPRLYQLRPDLFDFVVIIEPVDFFQNRSYLSLRNDVFGIGVNLFDNASVHGSPQRLMGVIRYPIAALFDGAERAFLHEVGHRWINFLGNAPLSGGIPHWPPSSLARDLMGFNIPGTAAGGTFPYDVQRRSNGTFELVCSGVSGVFSDLSLYLMGLLPADSVGTHYVLDDPDAARVCGSTVLATQVTIADVIAGNGSRVPDATSSPRDFATATVIVSAGRLLDANEMAFFSAMTSRAEARTELHFTSGFTSGMTKPFFLATGSRATMTTRMW